MNVAQDKTEQIIATEIFSPNLEGYYQERFLKLIWKIKNSLSINRVAGLFLLTAAATYLMGLTAGPEALKMAAAGFVCFITPHVGNGLVGLIGIASGRLMQFIMS